MWRFLIDLDDTLANTTTDLCGDPARIPRLTLVDGALEFLRQHKRRSILLTAGVAKEQQDKIDVLGIRKCFKDIIILSSPIKKRLWLEQFVRQFRGDPAHIVIVGDRLDVEIAKGNELGCTTVRVQLPGGAHSGQLPGGGMHQVIHHTVRDFRELLGLFPT